MKKKKSAHKPHIFHERTRNIQNHKSAVTSKPCYIGVLIAALQKIFLDSRLNPTVNTKHIRSSTTEMVKYQ